MKKLIKLIVAGAILYSGLWRLLFAVNRLLARTQPVFILMYHRVMPRGTPASDQPWLIFRSLPGIVVSPEMFKQQIAYLTEHFSVISLEKYVEHIDNKRDFQRASVVITFDDGWRDNYKYALPILKHAMAPATIFLSTGFVGTTRIYWPERLLNLFSYGDRTRLSVSDLPQELLSAKLRALLLQATAADSDALESLLDECIRILKNTCPETREELIVALSKQVLPNGTEQVSERVVLDWNEVEIMQKGGISFGSHGVNHELFTEISRDEVERELRESAEMIAARISPGILTLAYPNGSHNEAIQKSALELGYRCAVTVKRGVASKAGDIMTLPRINVHEDVSRGLTGNFSPALFAWHINRAIW